MKTVERIVAVCCRWPLAVILISLLLAASGTWYTTQNFAMNTDSEQLIDAKVGWRMRQARFDAAFPQKTNLTAVVIDGDTPELAESRFVQPRPPPRWRHLLQPERVAVPVPQ